MPDIAWIAFLAACTDLICSLLFPLPPSHPVPLPGALRGRWRADLHGVCVGRGLVVIKATEWPTGTPFTSGYHRTEELGADDRLVAHVGEW
jgi:hypothetical protein